MCAGCAAGGPLCPNCVALRGDTAFPFTREDHDFSRLWDWTFAAWKKQAVLLAVATMIMFGAGFVGSLLSNIGSQMGLMFLKTNPALGVTVIGFAYLVGTGLAAVAQGAVQLGLVRMMISALNGQTIELGQLFTQLKKVGAFIVQWLVLMAVLVVFVALVGGVMVGVAVLFGTNLKHGLREFDPLVMVLFLAFSLAVLALVVWGLPVIFAPMEIAYGNASGLESLRRAFVIGAGRRVELLGYSLLMGLLTLGAVLAGVVALCVGLLVTVPAAMSLQQMLLTAKYLALRNGADVPPASEV